VVPNNIVGLDWITRAVSYPSAKPVFSKEVGMLRKAWVIGVSAALAACVFGATAGFSDDTPPPRVRGTLDQVNGNMLTIKTRSGTPTTVQRGSFN
jgi:hypothetical protein